ncbi:MAG: hypothetical protein MUF71_05935 [Candidatus Kapabacteria bacterium]|jgi:hypothetical protein|nr:hypothetical protein [Candidatus Kapabacteria bacterium]
MVACVLACLSASFRLPAFAQKPDIRAVGVTEDGKEVSLETIIVSRQMQQVFYALPSVIEFGKNSVQLPSTLAQIPPLTSKTYQIERLLGYEFLNSEVLNVIGKRMNTSPAEVLTIGENDNTFPRSAAVKNYLQTIWSIAPERLQSKIAKQLPKDCNCVELSNETLLKPVALRDTVTIASPPIIRFYSTTATKEEYPQQWSIVIRQDSKPLRNPISAGGSIRPVVDWKINKERNTIPTTNSPMKYVLEVRYPTIPNERSLWKEVPVRIGALTSEFFVTRLFFKGQDKDINASNRAVLALFREKAFAEAPTQIRIQSYGQPLPEGSKEAAAQDKLLQQRLQIVEKALGTVLRQAKYEGKITIDKNFYLRENESVVVIEVERPLK